jgi:hypothetical protein
MTGEQLSSLSQIWFALPFPLLTGALYFGFSRSPMAKRLRLSAHSAFLLLAYAYAVAVAPWTSSSAGFPCIWPFWLLLAAFLLSGAYAIVRCDGPRRLHLL